MSVGSAGKEGGGENVSGGGWKSEEVGQSVDMEFRTSSSCGVTDIQQVNVAIPTQVNRSTQINHSILALANKAGYILLYNK